MGVSTVTAARILEGQMRGGSGEENQLAFEELPYLALSKTYQVNQQTPDSAPTMTSMVTGVKTDEGVLSIDQTVVRGDHLSFNETNKLETIIEIAEKRGMASGVVSTARITHATPAACYAHTPDRDWEDDADIKARNTNAFNVKFPDIARQLIDFPFGDGLEVALGGGRSKFIPNTVSDPEDSGRKGTRLDGRDLPTEWTTKLANASYVWNKAQFDSIDPSKTDHLLGLFERSHMEFEHDRPMDAGGEPSLTEMTTKAIDILAKNPRGFVLMVEAGRIDHGHHAGNAYRALTDAIEFSDAVRAAMQKTSPEETLIIVTADHSHVFTIGGYPTRGNPIMGLVRENLDNGSISTTNAVDLLGLPYTTLAYANGPGFTGPLIDRGTTVVGSKAYGSSPTNSAFNINERPLLTESTVTNANYLQESVVPLNSETHAGEDVAIYAGGPGSHLFHGTMEQNVIFHVMVEAMKPVVRVAQNRFNNIEVEVDGRGVNVYRLDRSTDLKSWSPIVESDGSFGVVEPAGTSGGYYRVTPIPSGN